MSKKINITDEELYQHYIIENMTVIDIAEMYSCSQGPLYRLIKKLGYKKDRDKMLEAAQTRSKKTCLEKYGVEFALQAPEVREKIEKVCEEKYGGKSSAVDPEVRRKMRETCKKNNGAESPWSCPTIREKCFSTMRERYGEELYSSEILLEKRRQTSRDRYGVDNPMQSEEIKQRLRENFEQKYGKTSPSAIDMPKETQEIVYSKEKFDEFYGANKNLGIFLMAQKLKCSDSFLRKRAHFFGYDEFAHTSSGEIEIRGILKEWGIKYETTRKIIPPYEIDIYCPEYKIGIEYNGDYWHSEDCKEKKLSSDEISSCGKGGGFHLSYL